MKWIRLVIRHPGIDPDIISKSLDLKPNRLWKKGDQVSTPKGDLLQGLYKETMWSYLENIEDNDEIIDRIIRLINLFENNKEFLRHLEETGGTLNLFLDFPGSENGGDVIGWSELCRLGQLKVNLGFEIFPDV